MRFTQYAIATGLVAGLSASALAADPLWEKVGETFGKAGTEMPGDIYRIALPRTDIKATLDGIELKPGFALGGWLAFQKMSGGAMVMGDLVLTPEEVNPVMTKLLAGGSRSRRYTTTCSAITLSQCTCTSMAKAIP